MDAKLNDRTGIARLTLSDICGSAASQTVVFPFPARILEVCYLASDDVSADSAAITLEIDGVEDETFAVTIGDELVHLLYSACCF